MQWATKDPISALFVELLSHLCHCCSARVYTVRSWHTFFSRGELQDSAKTESPDVVLFDPLCCFSQPVCCTLCADLLPR